MSAPGTPVSAMGRRPLTDGSRTTIVTMPRASPSASAASISGRPRHVWRRGVTRAPSDDRNLDGQATRERPP